MSEVYYRGADVSVTADGAVVGGVLGVTCGQENTVEEFGEYLTDVPVRRVTRERYTVRLTTCAKPYAAIGLEPETLTLDLGDRCVTYADCRVESVKCEILPDAAVNYVVTLSAGERSVEND